MHQIAEFYYSDFGFILFCLAGAIILGWTLTPEKREDEDTFDNNL